MLELGDYGAAVRAGWDPKGVGTGIPSGRDQNLSPVLAAAASDLGDKGIQQEPGALLQRGPQAPASGEGSQQISTAYFYSVCHGMTSASFLSPPALSWDNPPVATSSRNTQEKDPWGMEFNPAEVIHYTATVV